MSVITTNTRAIVTEGLSAEAKANKTAATMLHNARAKANVGFTRAVDDLFIAWGTSGKTKADFLGKSTKNPVRAELAALAAEGVELGSYQKEMADAIYGCMTRAFFGNLTFSRDLKNTHDKDGNPRAEKAEGDTEGESAGTSGAVTTTSPESCEKTARKLIAQLRMVNTERSNATAAGIVDVMLEFNPEFSETEAKK